MTCRRVDNMSGHRNTDTSRSGTEASTHDIGVPPGAPDDHDRRHDRGCRAGGHVGDVSSDTGVPHGGPVRGDTPGDPDLRDAPNDWPEDSGRYGDIEHGQVRRTGRHRKTQHRR